MSRVTLLGGGRKWLLALALAGISGAVIAQKSPESLLPPGFDAPVEPAPVTHAKEGAGSAETVKAPASGGAAAAGAAAAPATARGSGAVAADTGLTAAGAAAAGLSDDELLNSIDPALIKQLEDASRPKYDIAPADSRSLAIVGALDQSDGGFPAQSTRNLGGDYVAALLTRFKGPLVSRWGQIMVRRALVSRLATPVGMNGADWAAFRAQVLLRMGEADAARLMVEQVDNANYTTGLEDAAMESFLASADPVGLCPIAQLTAVGREGWQWDMTHAICAAFTHSDANAMSRLDRIQSDGASGRIDSLLAQKFAGAVATKRRAVKIEWDKVDSMTPWRFGLALASGVEPPAELVDKAGTANSGQFRLFEARAPMLPLSTRAAAADRAGARGVLSAAAMVDLYGQILAEGDPKDQWTKLASTLRTAYVGPAQADRLAAIKALWGDDTDPERVWSRHVLTAYAAARLQPSDAMADDAAGLIGAMLSAGLDANAMQWAAHVARGSQAWGTLALAAQSWNGNGIGDALATYYGKDQSTDALRSKFLLAGLMGLGRVSGSEASSFASKLSINLTRRTRWTDAIDAAAASGNQTFVALLAGFGMQGAGWTKMTPLHLYHIVGALHRVGLDGEARMIAAEAVSRV